MSGNWLDLSSSSNRYIQTYMKGFLDMSGGNLLLRNNNIIVAAGDISLNGRMFVGNDASLSGRLFVSKDLSLNSKLFVGGDTSMNGNVYARGTIITDASSYTDVKGTFLVENNVNVTGIINQSTINLSGGMRDIKVGRVQIYRLGRADLLHDSPVHHDDPVGQ